MSHYRDYHKETETIFHPNKFVYLYWTYQTYESQVGVLEEDQTVSSVSYLNIENKNVKNYYLSILKSSK